MKYTARVRKKRGKINDVFLFWKRPGFVENAESNCKTKMHSKTPYQIPKDIFSTASKIQERNKIGEVFVLIGTQLNLLKVTNCPVKSKTPFFFKH